MGSTSSAKRQQARPTSPFLSRKWPPQEHCGKSRYRLRHCHILLLLADANSIATREGVPVVPVVPMEDVPKILCHRTTRDNVGGILQDGLVPGALGSGRVRCYFAQTAVGSDDYRSGVRAYAPIEVKWNTMKLMALRPKERCVGNCARPAPSSPSSTPTSTRCSYMENLPGAAPSSSAAAPMETGAPMRKRQLDPQGKPIIISCAILARSMWRWSSSLRVKGEEVPETPPAHEGPARYLCPSCQAECFNTTA